MWYRYLIYNKNVRCEEHQIFNECTRRRAITTDGNLIIGKRTRSINLIGRRVFGVLPERRREGKIRILFYVFCVEEWCTYTEGYNIHIHSTNVEKDIYLWMRWGVEARVCELRALGSMHEILVLRFFFVELQNWTELNWNREIFIGQNNCVQSLQVSARILSIEAMELINWIVGKKEKGFSLVRWHKDLCNSTKNANTTWIAYKNLADKLEQINYAIEKSCVHSFHQLNIFLLSIA